MPFTLSSPAFGDRQKIPPKYTADGENVSPPLQWHEAPEGTSSYALIVDDPDAPSESSGIGPSTTSWRGVIACLKRLRTARRRKAWGTGSTTMDIPIMTAPIPHRATHRIVTGSA